jgi:hypothetical protein
MRLYRPFLNSQITSLSANQNLKLSNRNKIGSGFSSPLSYRNANQNTSFSTVLNFKFRVCPQTENSNSSHVSLSTETKLDHCFSIICKSNCCRQINELQSISNPSSKSQNTFRKTSFSARKTVIFQNSPSASFDCCDCA